MDIKLFESVYDTYAAMLYRLALDISSTKTEADEILFNTFKRFYQQGFIKQTFQSLCITLVNLTIQTAKEKLAPDRLGNIEFVQFKTTPLLHDIFLKQTSLLSYCQEKKLTEKQGLQMLQQEFNTIKNTQSIQQGNDKDYLRHGV